MKRYWVYSEGWYGHCVIRTHWFDSLLITYMSFAYPLGVIGLGYYINRISTDMPNDISMIFQDQNLNIHDDSKHYKSWKQYNTWQMYSSHPLQSPSPPNLNLQIKSYSSCFVEQYTLKKCILYKYCINNVYYVYARICSTLHLFQNSIIFFNQWLIRISMIFHWVFFISTNFKITFSTYGKSK